MVRSSFPDTNTVGANGSRASGSIIMRVRAFAGVRPMVKRITPDAGVTSVVTMADIEGLTRIL